MPPGIRANTPVDIRAIRAAVDLPIIGLYKIDVPGYDVYITPTLAAAREVAAAGADVIAIDATARPRPEFASLAAFIAAIHDATGLPVLADISTSDEGVRRPGRRRRPGVDDDVRLHALQRAAGWAGHRPGSKRWRQR